MYFAERKRALLFVIMCICKPRKNIRRARKSLGVSLALQCYTGLESSGFPVIRNVDFFHDQQDCALPPCDVSVEVFLPSRPTGGLM